MSLTPYEMRFNYLHFAKEYLVNEYNASMEKIVLSEPNERVRKPLIENLKYPSREDIFNFAEQIKEFTSKK